jgi:16S rRNA (uracil1498-N3)-methyltransferase
MNSLVILPGEGWETGRCVIVGERARALSTVEERPPGDEIRVVMLGGDRGRARVARWSAEVIEIELVETERSTPLRRLDIIVGLSRPQTLKKVIQAAVMAGARSLHFVRTESGERSYLDSHVLRPDDLQQEVMKALEQIWDGYYPRVEVHRSFAYFASRHLAGFGTGERCLKMIASPGASILSARELSEHVESMIVAVGPEAGWSHLEVEAFRGNGFIPAGLGSRVVRVEVALNYLLGQSLLLQGL